MDFYCKIKLKDGSFLMIEDVFQKVKSLDWTRENAGVLSTNSAMFEGFGANDDPYMLLVDLKDTSNKTLVRYRDQKIVFRGTSV